MTTIVTAFLSNMNNFKTIEKYIEYGKKLILIPQQKIVYIEKYIYDLYFTDMLSDSPVADKTLFRFIEKKDLYLYEYYDEIINFNIITPTPNKDTIEYMFVINNKTNWIKEAIEENPYDSNQFIWIDFGIYHVINNDELFLTSINNACCKTYDNIRIASGFFNGDESYIYRRINWFFLGGIFGGHKDKLIKFADLMQEKCISIIKTEKTLCWEVNIWYLIYKEHSELFSNYLADHNVSMILEY